MDHQSNRALQQFRNEIGIKFQLYNSLFTSLPFHRIEKTGILLSLLSNNCEEGYKKRSSPSDIIEDFFNKHTTYVKEDERTDLLFRFVQYIERQVVLFDALEDAAFKSVNDLNGVGTLKHLESEVLQGNKQDELAVKLKDFAIRLVLTAHPTQFYPGPVLGIINDLAKALAENNTNLVNTYLQQLGKTPFFKKKKPTPYDEAVSLIWYLENVFYPAAGRIISSLKNQFPDAVSKNNPVIRMGFWPGGDRDGNPFVTSDITLQVSNALRSSIVKCYYMDVRRLRRRLTFAGVEVFLQELENKLYNNLFIPGFKTNLKKDEVLITLNQIKEVIIHQHNGLFLHMVNNLINKIEVFGLHFASLDIRQDSSVHGKVLQDIAADQQLLPAGYAGLTEQEKIEILSSLTGIADADSLSDPLSQDTLKTIRVVKEIQQFNGTEGCSRYIISQCNSALNAMEVYGLFLLAGWKKEEMAIDIVPLFETIDDLQEAATVMRTLYTHPVYKEHLKRRGNQQTIMLGFSDGTKDGGYLMANWSIYKAKEELTRISRENEVDVIFFDGRGGPPSRGGGKTHKFYASMGHNISNKEIQLTIQGQTVSSNFGTIDAAQFNIEQLLNAGISNDLFSNRDITLNENEESLLQELAEAGFTAYKSLKDHPYLADYLLQVSPLRFYSETNIGSRPAKRGASSGLSLKDLRAIPFAGSWSQLKQNVTGYYGVGSALQQMEKQGKLLQLQKLYHQSLFFRTLLDNCEMAMMKSFFPLTAFLSNHKQFGELWHMIYDEYELTRQYLFKITGHNELMADYPVEQLSIQMRERIVLPLVTIQQYALTKIRELEEQLAPAHTKETFEKLAMRCSFGIINAGRNSA
ncbi:MAG TPA: phosphoenolpyruvate carboxylase [Chitinophagaceae bacterium]|nr:phosphoenolpyruvate carboxylase [Chitinophagaceae bacterium]HQZ73024.1 phosphoenolpyruvate carboxylase [Chitinophagaceae bacterium]